MTYDETEQCNYQYTILEVDEDITGVGRDQLVQILQAENVLARRYFYPGCHNMEPYRSYFPHARLMLPQTEEVVRRVLALPTGTAVGSEDISLICQIIRFACQNGQAIREKLSA